MRLAAQAKGGYYPYSPLGVIEAARLIDAPRGQFTVIDPCCGEGAAVLELAACTGASPDGIYGIELEDERAEKALKVSEHMLAPASFFSSRISVNSFGLAWVNPPFDDEAGGGQRVELNFLVRATEILAPGGVMMFVIPESQVGGSWRAAEIHRFFQERFDNHEIIVPSCQHRPYNEVICIGSKRKKPVIAGDDLEPRRFTPIAEVLGKRRWHVPVTGHPKAFEKAGMTDRELAEAICASPLWSITEPPRSLPPARPPLPLTKGHIALMLASGQCDGVLSPDGEEPHLVRGTAMKVKCEPETTEDVDASGNLKTTTIVKEEIKIVIRAVGQDGEIRTFE